jgi:hypothetical protein
MWGGLLLVLEIEVVDLNLVALISPGCRIDAYPNRSPLSLIARLRVLAPPEEQLKN